MPVDLRHHNPDDNIDIDPGTNKARLVKHLYRNPHLGYKPAELHAELEIPKGSVTTTLLRLVEGGYIGKTSDGYYHALENRADLRRFATGLVQAEHLTARYDDDGLTPDDVEQTAPGDEQLEQDPEDGPSNAEVDQERDELEAAVDAERKEQQNNEE